MKQISHYDLDGCVCAILLKSFIPNLEVKAIGYNALNETIDEFVFNNKKLIITDLSLDKHHIQNMKMSKHDILYIDHHQSSLEFKDQSTDKLKIYINEKFCAAGNVMKYFKDKQKFSQAMKTLTYLTNDYDMWILKERESKILNYIFWTRKFNAFMKMFEKGYDSSIVESFRKPFEKHEDGIKKYFDKREKYEIDFNDDVKFLMIFADKNVSDVTLVYPDFDFYFIISDKYKMSIRCGEKYNFNNAIEKVDCIEGVESCGGHLHAGGLIIVKNMFNDSELVDFYYKLIETIIKESIK